MLDILFQLEEKYPALEAHSREIRNDIFTKYNSNFVGPIRTIETVGNLADRVAEYVGAI